jgi:hypothetical protein
MDSSVPNSRAVTVAVFKKTSTDFRVVKFSRLWMFCRPSESNESFANMVDCLGCTATALQRSWLWSFLSQVPRVRKDASCRLVTSTASYGTGRACGSTRNCVPACSSQTFAATVEFRLMPTVAHGQAGTRWDVETRHIDKLLRSAVTRITRYEPTGNLRGTFGEPSGNPILESTQLSIHQWTYNKMVAIGHELVTEELNLVEL